MMQSFIKARLNKDNFWNLMFLTLPSLAIFIAQSTMNAVPGGLLILLATLIFAPYLVSRVNKVEYKNDMFHSSGTKRVLCPNMPEAVGFVLWSAIPFVAFWILFLHKKYPHLDENLAIYNLIFWFVPTIYFILKNLPIAFIFNKTAWAKSNGTSVFHSSNNNWRNNSRHFSVNSDSKHTCMSYDYLPGNMYHGSYLDRYRK